MNAAEQFQEWGAAVEASEQTVVLRVGREYAFLTPRQAQRFAFHLAHAYIEAAGGVYRSPSGTFKLKTP